MILLPALMLTLATQGNGPSVALVVDLKGKGTLRGPNLVEPLVLLMELPRGGSLHLEAGARMVWVTLTTGEEITVQGPNKFTLDAGGIPVGLKKGVQRKVLESLKLKESLKPGGLAQASLVMRNPQDFELLNPREGALRKPPTSFQWEALEGASYRFSLQDSAGKSLYEQEGSEASLELPATVQLGPGTYLWRVGATEPNGKRRQTERGFQILSPERMALLEVAQMQRSQSFARAVLYAALLEEIGLHAEAKAEWKALAKARKDDPTLAAFAK